MRRHGEFLEERDGISDEEGLFENWPLERQDSISDEEDLIENWRGNLNEGGKNKQLERFSLKNDIEMPVSIDEESEFTQSSRKFLDEESIPNREKIFSANSSFISKCMKPQKKQCHNFKGDSQDGASTWSTVFKETEELIYIQEKAGCYSSHHTNSEAKRVWKGNRGKAKPKFSIHFQTLQEELPVIIMTRDEKEKASSAPQLLNGLDNVGPKTTVQSMTELIDVFQEEQQKHFGDHQMLSTSASLSHRDTVQSVAEIMEGLQETSGQLKESSKLSRKGKRFSCTGKKNATLGDRIFNEENPFEAIDSGKSSEDEAADFLLQDTDKEKLKLATTVIKGRTVADRFLEAFDAAIENNGQTIFKTFKQSNGYHGRLQQVIQTEKETNLYFLKQSQAENKESRCIDVRILSRYLDAKLTVCECSLVKSTERSQCLWNPKKLMDSGGRRIIIFNSKTCGDVGLEIGKAIRLHPPWKEVELVESGGSIILCTYFSSISMTSPVSN